ncbi:hypothetical protein HA402_012562 [Bradysia odoriphaga]|nr:hypothetical protein HA402_012562 [Bradysia odoriphaga]
MQPKSNQNIFTIFKSMYHNEYQWSLIKGIALFAIGVKIAQECDGLDIMPAI